MGIVLKNICKSFDGKAVLKDFSFEMEKGETVAVMGESGSGKTTLLNILAGLISPDSGVIEGMYEESVAFVFQEDRLAENFTIYRNIKLACDDSVSKENIADSLEAIGLERSLIKSKVSTLSGGMKRRVAILRALLSGSSVLLLDEPTKGLDDTNKHLVTDYILRKSQGMTVLWVTHDEKEARYVSDRILTF